MLRYYRAVPFSFTGAVLGTTSALDFETTSLYNLLVEVSDVTAPIQTTTVTVIVQVFI